MIRPICHLTIIFQINYCLLDMYIVYNRSLNNRTFGIFRDDLIFAFFAITFTLLNTQELCPV